MDAFVDFLNIIRRSRIIGSSTVFAVLFLFGTILFSLPIAQGCDAICVSGPADCNGSTAMSCCQLFDTNNCGCTPDPLPNPPTCGPGCVSDVGQSCNVINSCYMPGFGTTQCDGSCDAVAPSDDLCGGGCDPNQGQSCDSYNTCGMGNGGRTQCDGSCDATPPSDALCSGHRIVASAGPGGSISPSGSVFVLDGGSQLFNIVPRSGFRVRTVFFDGTDMGVITGSYRLNNVRSDHTVMVTFESTSGASCGNGVVESGEACDNGASSNGVCPASCSTSCASNTCVSVSAALNICPDGATLLTGGTQQLRAWYTSSHTSFMGCSDTTGATDRTQSVQWSSSNPSRASVSNSGVRGVVTAGTIPNASVTITANYLARGRSDTATINILAPPCTETRSCTAAAVNRCVGDTFTIAGVCGRIDCVGTRSCDYNWKEVTP